jgi:hypothetical protein
MIKRAGVKLVDVTGIEPVTPCLQSGAGKTLKGFAWCRLHEPSMNFPLLNCPEVVPSRPRPETGREKFPGENEQDKNGTPKQ